MLQPNSNNHSLFQSVFEVLEDRVLFDGVPDATFAMPEADATAAAPAQTQSQQASEMEIPRELIIIDSGVEDVETLLAGIIESKPDTALDIRILDSNSDGVQQITDILASSEGKFDAIHILSHGNEGEVNLGNSSLSAANAAEYADQLSTWADALTEDADLLIYGCDLAGDQSGHDLISYVSAVTGADVAASDDLTGAEELGGDWDLEVNVGTVETAAVSATAFNGVLLGDADGDGLDHDVDLDDDNDGILDSVEGFRTFALESDAFPSAPVAINGGDSDNLQTCLLYTSPSPRD